MGGREGGGGREGEGGEGGWLVGWWEGGRGGGGGGGERKRRDLLQVLVAILQVVPQCMLTHKWSTPVQCDDLLYPPPPPPPPPTPAGYTREVVETRGSCHRTPDIPSDCTVLCKLIIMSPNEVVDLHDPCNGWGYMGNDE